MDLLLSALERRRPQLEALETSGLDGWLGAGCLRNPVWDALFGVTSAETDWDVALFGQEGQAHLEALLPGPWEAVDQARYGHSSAEAGLASWPETATAVGARLVPGGIEVLAPWGLQDLLAGVLRRSGGFTDLQGFARRSTSKGWARRWPGLRLEPWRPGRPELEPIRLARPW
jgi:hypothetical protein